MYISKETSPEEWDEKYYLVCVHNLNNKSKIKYLMYCNVIKEMQNDRVKLTVVGTRWHNTIGEKIRYIDDYRLSKSSLYE